MRGHDKHGETWGLLAGLVALALLPADLRAYPGFLREINSISDWESIALGSGGIKYIAPGTDPASTPIPCLDFVIYGPGVQHIDIIEATGLDCVADFTVEEMNRMRFSLTQFAGYIARVPDPGDGSSMNAVYMHNDRFLDPEITPELVSHVMRALGATFNEAELGRLVYMPIVCVAQERAREWLADPDLELDFEIYFHSDNCPPPAIDASFVRGDIRGNGEILIGDAIFLLNYLYRGGVGAPPCLDAADVNDDGRLSGSDAVYLLRSLFLGGPPPPAPFRDCGPDLTTDGLSCESYDAC
jgi:hypothetical protein